MNVINSWGKLVCISDNYLFKSINCGYSHALLIDQEDKIFSFGANIYGQLGIGIGEFDYKAAKAVPVDDVNDGGDKVLMIACGAHFSLCYTELGILYYWGMLVPEDTNSIQWIPSFMSISIPKDISEIELLSFKIVDIKASFREVLACDSQGRVYFCDLQESQTLKNYPSNVQRIIGPSH